MKIILFACLIFSICISQQLTLKAQDKPEQVKPMRSWIHMIGNQPNSYNKLGPVSLIEIKDSSIVISKNFGAPELEIPVFDLGIIKTRKKNSLIKGMLIGTASGFVAGSLTGLIAGDDPENIFLPFTAEEKALRYGTYLGLAGIGIGAVYGSVVKISIPVHGNMDLYNQNKYKLMKYSVKRK